MLHRYFHLPARSRLTISGGKRYWVCDQPLQAFALNETAWLLLEALRADIPLDALLEPIAPETLRFLEEKAGQGALEARYRLSPPASLPAFEVIIPVLDNPEGLQRCLAGLARQEYPPERVAVTVVDDASSPPLRSRVHVPDMKGVKLRWLRLPHNQGPGAARNAAVGEPWPWGDGTPAPLVAFIDSDCVPAPDWLPTLAALLETPGVHAAGTQVRPLRTDTLLAAYEGACSSLNLGARPGPVGGASDPLSYLPSCNLGLRREAFVDAGGFRPDWRFGEDVDLCWRLRHRGYELFYFPAGAVAHDHRHQWVPFFQRKRAYAYSEARLKAHHPHHYRFRPPWGVWAALGLLGTALLGTPPVEQPLLGLMGAGLALCLEGAAPFKALWSTTGSPRPHWPLRGIAAAAARRAMAVMLGETRRLTRKSLVTWLPGLIALPRLWPLALGVFILGAVAEWSARRPGLPVRVFVVGYATECLAYSLGRLEGSTRNLWNGFLLWTHRYGATR